MAVGAPKYFHNSLADYEKAMSKDESTTIRIAKEPGTGFTEKKLIKIVRLGI